MTPVNFLQPNQQIVILPRVTKRIALPRDFQKMGDHEQNYEKIKKSYPYANVPLLAQDPEDYNNRHLREYFFGMLLDIKRIEQVFYCQIDLLWHQISYNELVTFCVPTAGTSPTIEKFQTVLFTRDDFSQFNFTSGHQIIGENLFGFMVEQPLLIGLNLFPVEEKEVF